MEQSVRYRGINREYLFVTNNIYDANFEIIAS